MKIAIVEDEKKLAEMLQSGLQAHGYDAEIFGDGLVAEGRLVERDSGFDAVILDLDLPGKGGFQVCKAVRKAGRIMPIIFLTASDSLVDKVMALDSGADDYLSKPFVFSELLARLRAMLRRPLMNIASEQIVVGPITLDAGTHEVFRDGERIQLTLKQFDLLACLMRQRDRVLSRAQIADELWGSDHQLVGNVIDVHIRHLREKIDDGHRQKIIHTVHGRGYTVRG